MPNKKGLDPIDREKKKLEADIAAELKSVTPFERAKIAIDLEVTDRTITNYGKYVYKLTLGYKILEELRKVTAGRKAAA